LIESSAVGLFQDLRLELLIRMGWPAGRVLNERADGQSSAAISGQLEAAVSGQLEAAVSGQLEAAVSGQLEAAGSGQPEAAVSGRRFLLSPSLPIGLLSHLFLSLLCSERGKMQTEES
jgi:hypothetical protein